MTINELYRQLEPFVENGLGDTEVLINDEDKEVQNLREVIAINYRDVYIPYKSGKRVLITI